MYDLVKAYKEQALKKIKENWQIPYASVREGAYSILGKTAE